MSSIVDQGYWDMGYESLPLAYDPEKIEFKELFGRYLKSGGTVFEVGCYPGNFLIYLGKRFGYTVSGIDRTPFVLTRMPEHLAKQGIKVGKLIHGDLLDFRSEDTYDVVCSFGFVEHFFNLEEVIEKHIQLVGEQGILILACPNFRGLQYVLHRLLDPTHLQRHVVEAMDFARWKAILERNGMRVIYQGYYRTFDFWVDTPRPGRLPRLAVKYIKLLATKLDKRLNWPNPFLSPYMISFSSKERL